MINSIINYIWPKNETPALFTAIRNRNPAQIEELIQESPEQVQAALYDGSCPLTEARRYQIPMHLTRKIEQLDEGFAEEVFLRKELAHRFGLDGTSRLSGQVFELEGMYSTQALRMATDSATPFYAQLLNDLELNSGSWTAVLDQLPEMTRDWVASGPPAETAQRLRRIPKLVSQALHHRRQNVQTLQDRLNRDGLIPFFHGWLGHFVSGVVDRVALTRANKGQRPATHAPGLITHHIGSPQQVAAAVKALCTWTQDAFYQELDSALELQPHRISLRSPQKVGNCSSSAGYALESALIQHLFQDIFTDEDAALFAHAVKKQRALFTRRWTLERYLSAHGCDSRWPADVDLIGRTLTKKGVTVELAEKVFDWMRSHGYSENEQQEALKPLTVPLGFCAHFLQKIY